MEDLDKIKEQLMEALRRDTKTILMESASKKLSPTSSKNLVDYLKFITDEEARQEERDSETSQMSDEELKAHAKAILEGDTKSTS